jgi:hypothetical protein
MRVWGEEKPVREFREMTSSTSEGSKGGDMSMGLGDSDTREVSTSSFATSS